MTAEQFRRKTPVPPAARPLAADLPERRATGRGAPRRQQTAKAERARLLARERRARSEAEYHAERLSRLQAITSALGEAITLEDVARVVVDQGMTALGAAAGSLNLLSADGQELRRLYASGSSQRPAGPDGGLSMTVVLPAATVARDGEPLFFPSAEDLLAAYPHLASPVLDQDHGAQPVLLLRSGGEVVGTLCLRFPTQRALTDDDQTFLLTLAEQCTQALQRTRLFCQLAQQSQRVERLLDGAPDPLLIVGESGQYIGANAAALAITGYTRDELLALSPADLTHLPPGELTSTQVRERGVGATLTAERTLYRKDGAAVPVETHAALLSLPDGAQVVTVALRDLTPRKALERTLINAEKLKSLGQLAAGVAHDLNNTLGAIIGPVQLAREALSAGQARPEQLLADLAFIERAAQDAAQTVRQLQLFARGRAAPELPLQPVTPDDLLGDVVALTRPRWRDQARSEGRTISVRIERQGAPPILASAAELKEALVNLVHNAADAMPKGGTIRISSRKGEGPDGAAQAVLAVSDDGTGMDEETQARLFEPFFSTKPPGKGLGMGMAMVQGIVQRLGGQIDLETALEHGTTVMLYLPAAPPVAALTAPVAPEAGPPRRILIVENEDHLRRVTERMLRRGGHTVQAVASAEAALDLLTDPGGFHVVVTDVGLPGRSGWQLTQDICRRFPSVIVIVATGWAHSLPDDELAAFGVPRDRLLSKPYRIEELLACIARAAMGQ